MDLEPPFPWMKDKPNTLQHHLENNTGTVFEYTRARRHELGRRILGMHRIYLDTKYWLYARDVYLGRPQKPSHVEIVELLRTLRRLGSVICPISYPVFDELWKQSDSITRQATAEMIDELSDDCTIQPFFELFKAELYHFYVKITKPNVKLRPLAETVWTKAAFVLGDIFLNPEETGLPQHLQVAMTKAMDDLLWSIKLTEFIDGTPLPPDDPREMKALVSQLTHGKINAWNPKHTFRKLYLDEVAGVLDGMMDVLGDFMTHLAREAGYEGAVNDEEKMKSGEMLAGLIFGAFQHNRITTDFPTIDVPALLHATVRMDNKRPYRDGDVEDFFHAAAAVGYFNSFLTERSLKHSLLSKPVDVENKYGCRILATEDEVLEHLREMA
jgi:hypothetical protein